MERHIEELFAITRFALAKKPYLEPITDFKKLFTAARENGLSGLFYPVLKDNDSVDDEEKLLLKEYYLYQTKDIAQTKTAQLVSKLFSDIQADHAFLKGMAIKKYYPETYMRSMGDIDILIQPEALADSKSILQKHGFKLHSEGSTHDVYFKGKGLMLEVHPGVDHHLDPKHVSALGSVFADAISLGDHQYELAPEKQLLYLLAHLHKHFLSSGIGLRQVLDIGVFLTAKEKEMDIGKLHSLLDHAGLTRFANSMIAFNNRAVGFTAGKAILGDFVIDENLFEDTAAFVISAGIHGTADDFNKSVPALTKHSLKANKTRGSKRRYLLQVLFPKRDDLMAGEKYLKKHGWLLPYAWVKRWFRLAFKKTKRSIYKLKSLNVEKEVIEEQVSLYQRLGIK